MFLGYQKGQIVLVKPTREELENAPCMVFDEIVETQDEYVLWGGEYILKTQAAEREKQAQIEALRTELDALDLKAIRALRAIEAGVGTQDDEDKLAELEEQAALVRRRIQELSV